MLPVSSALEYERNGDEQRHRVDDVSAAGSSKVATVRRVQLDPNPQSVAAARDECDDLLHDLHVAQDMISTACVIVSELVSNAVLHARTASELALEAHGRTLRVEVTDASIDDLHTCGSASTSLTTTGAPSAANASACARPMPRPAPVTTTTRSWHNLLTNPPDG